MSLPRRTFPVLPREFVPRPSLLSTLDHGEDAALTLVSAPPGYGKTVLLADWAGHQDAACAWVTLHEKDDDPRTLWAAVLSALVACPGVPASSALNRLVVPRTTVGADFLAELLEALATLPVRVCLVLDDVHHLRGKATLHGLRVLVRDRPSTVRLLMAGRYDPALPIGRLRMEGRLWEVRAEQLRFSLEETAALSHLCGVDLTEAQSQVLHARTDGWVAGIRLAAIPLVGHPDPDRFLASFSGDERPVADYLADEVVAHLSTAERELLRRTSITDPLPTRLAAELSGRPDAAELLGELERRTGLVVSSGAHRAEFRVQELVRTYLAADLNRQGPEVVRELHRQAATWWAAEARPVPALRHAAQTADDTLLIELLHRWAPTLVARGDHTELGRALASGSAGGHARDPWLLLAAAHIHLVQGDVQAARAEIRRAEGPARQPDDPDLARFRAATRQLSGLAGRDEETAPADPALAALVSLGRGAARVYRGDDARPSDADAEAAVGELETALATARDHQFGLLEVQSLCLLGMAASAASDNSRAAAAAAAAVGAATARGWQDSWWTGTAHGVLAHACLMRAAPEQALEAAVDGLRTTAAGDPVLRFALRCARGAALFDLGARSTGLLELQQAQGELGGTVVPRALAASAALLEHRAALVLGYRAAAATSMGRLSLRDPACGELVLMRAWSEAAAGAPARAHGVLLPLLEGGVPPTLESTLVEAWLLEAWTALRSSDRPGARRALRTALARAEPLDVLRPFALAGRGLRVLLVDQLGGDLDPVAFAFRCLAARQRVRPSSAPQLSAREQEVLAQLVSLNNLDEIADDLDVSVNTIKTHVRGIYGKLGVNTRRTAVLAAVERGVLA